MATVVQSLPTKLMFGPGCARKYNFDQYMDGQAYKFTANEDFKTTPKSFASTIRAAAASRGWRSSVLIRGMFVFFQVTGKKA